MIIERQPVVVNQVDDTSTSMGMILLVALIAVAVGVTAWYFTTFNHSNTVTERTTEVHDTVPAPAAPPAAPVIVPQQVAVPQPVLVPAAPALPAPSEAPAAPQSSDSAQ